MLDDRRKTTGLDRFRFMGESEPSFSPSDARSGRALRAIRPNCRPFSIGIHRDTRITLQP
jgi:hypothetical protein